MTVKVLKGSKVFAPAFDRARIWSQIGLWLRRADQRRQLLDLDARMLRDVGLTREQALDEAAKPFWRA